MSSPVKTGSPRFVSQGHDRAIQCRLCPRQCLIPPGASGQCRVRENKAGRMGIPLSGFITALGEDPIEKKPLYHFRPGSSILSLGFAGCNLRCPFCQNWRISQIGEVVSQKETPPTTPKEEWPFGLSGHRLFPEEVLLLVRKRGLTQIAYTYSEPLVHIEFLLDCMALCRKEGIANILVSNGCVSPAAAAEVLALTDAANVDLKCFSEETYAKTLGGNLFGVLHFIKEAYTAGVHLEITTLIVPGLNDSPGETRRCAEFISGLSREIPWHISAYHPDYHWDAPPTSPAALGEIARMGRDLLSHVYTGNISGEINNTPCPHCGAVLIHRRGYQVDTGGLILKEDDGKKVYTCAQCGQAAPVRY